jgi:threonine/homoserine/homoserine lactone efflux protein
MPASTFAAIAAFCAAAALLTVTPGLDTALIIRTSAGEGRRAGLAAAVGVALGCLFWTVVTALGLGALLAASRVAYTVLKWVGAAYLVWLGIRLILQPRSTFAVESAGHTARKGVAGWLGKGLLTNVLNPKVGVFYVSFLPQFVPQDVPVAPFILMLGVIHAAMGLLWLAVLARATRSIVQALKRPWVLKLLDRATGLVFIGFGARLALESRR